VYSSNKKLLEKFTTRVVLEHSSTRGSPTPDTVLVISEADDMGHLYHGVKLQQLGSKSDT